MNFEKTREKLIFSARKGLFESKKLVVFPSTYKILKKEGFKTTKLGTQGGGARNKLYTIDVNWKEAQPNSEPKNLAEELFAISSSSSPY